jgi:hypothetical protein
MEWQKIDTAPKDGSRFLAADSYSGRYVCRWGSHYTRSMDGKDKEGCVNADGQPGNTASPKHWMPLPPPPKA